MMDLVQRYFLLLGYVRIVICQIFMIVQRWREVVLLLTLLNDFLFSFG